MSVIYPPHFKLPENDDGRNFFLDHIKVWSWVISTLKNAKKEDEGRVAIEIGAFHGACSVWLLENFINRPIDFLHCIDINETSYLKNNLSPYKNVKLHLGLSSNILVNLLRECGGPVADLIYVDGSHIAKHVLEDGVIGWKLLKVGGIMIFDDYWWGVTGGVDDQPRTGIDAFLHGYQKHWEMVGESKWKQVYLKKIRYDITDRQLTGNYADNNPYFNKENL